MIEQARKAVAIFNFQSLQFSADNDQQLIKELMIMRDQSPEEEIIEICELLQATVQALEIRNTALKTCLECLARMDHV